MRSTPSTLVSYIVRHCVLVGLGDRAQPEGAPRVVDQQAAGSGTTATNASTEAGR